MHISSREMNGEKWMHEAFLGQPAGLDIRWHFVTSIKSEYESFRFLYLFGGASGTNYYNDFFKYNLFTKRWELLEPKGKPPKPRYKHEAVLTPQGNIFILGGISGDERFLDVFEFNTENNVWSPIMPVVSDSTIYRGRYGFTADLYDKCIVIFGGSDEKKLGSILRLHLGSKRWERVRVEKGSAIPEPRDFHSACIYQNKLTAFGVWIWRQHIGSDG